MLQVISLVHIIPHYFDGDKKVVSKVHSKISEARTNSLKGEENK